jgi:hypothetical protein
MVPYVWWTGWPLQLCVRATYSALSTPAQGLNARAAVDYTCFVGQVPLEVVPRGVHARRMPCHAAESLGVTIPSSQPWVLPRRASWSGMLHVCEVLGQGGRGLLVLTCRLSLAALSVCVLRRCPPRLISSICSAWDMQCRGASGCPRDPVGQVAGRQRRAHKEKLSCCRCRCCVSKAVAS